jgi:hypothetical protein
VCVVAEKGLAIGQLAPPSRSSFKCGGPCRNNRMVIFRSDSSQTVKPLPSQERQAAQPPVCAVALPKELGRSLTLTCHPCYRLTNYQ